MKTYKPWFIGRDAFVAREKECKGVVVCFITGQAYVQLAYAKEGTVIGVNQGGNVERPAGMAKVVSRFAKL